MPVGQLGPGDIFGEIGLLILRPRSATVAAQGRVEVLEIPVRAMAQIVKRRPEVRDLLWQFYQARLEKTLQAVKRARWSCPSS